MACGWSVTLRGSELGAVSGDSLLRRVVRAWLGLPTWLRWSPPIAVMAVLWWSSGRSPTPRAPDPLWSLLHNGMHVVAYATLAVVTWGAVRRSVLDNARRSSVVAWSVAVAYGVVDELHQSFVDDRVCSVCDLASDACGALLGVMALAAWFDRRSVRAWHWLAAVVAAAGCVLAATCTDW